MQRLQYKAMFNLEAKTRLEATLYGLNLNWNFCSVKWTVIQLNNLNFDPFANFNNLTSEFVIIFIFPFRLFYFMDLLWWFPLPFKSTLFMDGLMQIFWDSCESFFFEERVVEMTCNFIFLCKKGLKYLSFCD